MLWALIAFLVISHAVLFLLVGLQCQPIHKVWDTEVPGNCFSKHMVENINYVQAGKFLNSVELQASTLV